LNPRAPPCQGVLSNSEHMQIDIEQTHNRDNLGGGARGFNSPSLHIDWQHFQNFLLQRMTAKTAGDRMSYAKQYAHILTSGEYTPQLLQLSPNKRIHIQKALSCLARFTGRAEQWRQIRQQYQLSWSTGTEKIDAFSRFFDDSRSSDVMVQWLREAVQVLPSKHANLLLFCTLTGMRGSECIESVRLINQELTSSGKYYNPERQILQHYLYPNIFIRRTKAIYISIVNDNIIRIAQRIGNDPTLPGLKKAISNRKLSMHIKYCRKIQASWLKQHGIETEIINMLQGRIGKDIFLRHYMTPNNNFKDKVLNALEELQQTL
jgi:hypothetical protein